MKRHLRDQIRGYYLDVQRVGCEEGHLRWSSLNLDSAIGTYLPYENTMR